MFSDFHDLLNIFSPKEKPLSPAPCKTPTEFINRIPWDWQREMVMQLRTMIRNMTPTLDEHLRANTLCYEDNKGILFRLTIQDAFVCLDIHTQKHIHRDSKLLRGLDLDKGCIRFNASNPIKQTRIEPLIAKAITTWQQGVTTSGAMAVLGHR